MTLRLKNAIILDVEEDYKTVGNSRIGGKPDLPRQMNYPVFSNGFYEFIVQVNLDDYKIEGLPNTGMLSIFYGDLDKNEAIGYYFKDINELETKEIPIEEEFSGVTDFNENTISYKIKIESKKIRPREESAEFNDEQFAEEDNIIHWKLDFLHENSFLMQKGVEDKSDIYLKTNGFDRLIYRYGLYIGEETNTVVYKGCNANKDYNTIQDVLGCPITLSYEKKRYLDDENGEKWINQLLKFEREKNYHLKRFQDYKCLLSLASLNETLMFWGDLHKLEFYGYESDFLKEDFSNLNSTMPD